MYLIVVYCPRRNYPGYHENGLGTGLLRGDIVCRAFLFRRGASVFCCMRL